MLKKATIICCSIIICVAIFFYKQYNKPHVDIIKAKPNISLDVAVLIDEFVEDENKANSKYLDQILQVKGAIVKISHERGKTSIVLGKEKLFGNVSCHLLENKEKQKELKIGQTVVIKGICTGYLLDVILVRCVLIIN